MEQGPPKPDAMTNHFRNYLLMISSDWLTGVPPIIRHDLIAGIPSWIRQLEKCSTVSKICLASSRDGHTINPVDSFLNKRNLQT